MFEPMLGVTFTPTRIRASEKINVIPSRAELRVDCRVPPGLGEAEVRRGIAEVLGPEDDFRIEFTECMAGNRSPIETPLMDAITGLDLRAGPGAHVVPVILPGFTDSRHFREAFPEVRRLRLLPPPPPVAAPDGATDPRGGRAHRRARPRLRDGALPRPRGEDPRLKSREKRPRHDGARLRRQKSCERGAAGAP